MKKIELEIYKPTDSYEPPVGFQGPGYRDGSISYALSEVISDYQALTEAYLSIPKITRGEAIEERMIELAARFRGKAKWWTKVNGNVPHPSGEIRVAISNLNTMADYLEKALSKRRQAA